MPSITGCRPLRRTASATAFGKLPPPQMMASGVGTAAETLRSPPRRSGGVMFGFFAGILARWVHHPPFTAFADEGDDLVDARVVGELASDAFDPVGERAYAEKQLAIGATQLKHLWM